jgi:hypothetical protein
MNAGILAIWNDCAPAGRAVYERWYGRFAFKSASGIGRALDRHGERDGAGHGSEVRLPAADSPTHVDEVRHDGGGQRRRVCQSLEIGGRGEDRRALDLVEGKILALTLDALVAAAEAKAGHADTLR